MKKRIFAVLLLVLSTGALFGQDVITPTKTPGGSFLQLGLDAVWDYLVMLF